MPTFVRFGTTSNVIDLNSQFVVIEDSFVKSLRLRSYIRDCIEEHANDTFNMRFDARLLHQLNQNESVKQTYAAFVKQADDALRFKANEIVNSGTYQQLNQAFYDSFERTTQKKVDSMQSSSSAAVVISIAALVVAIFSHTNR